MQTRTKVIIAWIFTLIIIMGFLSVWVIVIIRNNNEEQLYASLHAVLSTYISDTLDTRQQILVQNDLQDVFSYVEEYQKSAMQVAENIITYTSFELIAINSEREIVFKTSNISDQELHLLQSQFESFLFEISDGQFVEKRSNNNVHYLATYYEPWDWYILIVSNTGNKDDSSIEIIWATVVWIGIVLALTTIVLFLLLNRSYLQPIVSLRKAAKEISTGNFIKRIQITSKGDLGILARDMEEMSSRLSKNEKQLVNVNKNLENEVESRTVELSKTNENLKENEMRLIESINELKEQRDLSQMYLDVAGVMIVALNLEGNITLINNKGCEILGYTNSELIGMNWIEQCIPKENSSDIQKLFNEMLLGKLSQYADHRNTIQTKDRKFRTLAFQNTVTYDALGKINGILSSGEDITEQVEAEREREILRDKLHQSQKMEVVSTLAGGIAHDLNNLLSGILGNIELALLSNPDASAKSYLESALTSFDRTKALSTQLLTLSKSSHLKREPLELQSFIKDSVIFALSGSKVQSDFTIAEDLFICNVDKNQIGQVSLLQKEAISNSR